MFSSNVFIEEFVLSSLRALRTGSSVGEHGAVTWEVVSSTPTGPTLRVLK